MSEESEGELHNLLIKFKLSSARLQEQCSDNLFLILKKEIPNFENAAPHFGFTQTEIAELRNDFDTERQRKLEMLWIWRRRHGSDATYLAIVNIFLRMNDKQLAEVVLGFEDLKVPSMDSRLNPATVTKYSNWDSMGEFEQEKIKNDLYLENQKIRRKYSSLTDDFLNSLEERNVKVGNLKLFCITTYNVSQGKSTPILLFKLQSVDTLADVLMTIHVFGSSSWFNIQMFKDIVEQFGSEDDKKKMKTYEENELAPYLQRSIFEMPSKSFSSCNASAALPFLGILLPDAVIPTGQDVIAIRHNLSQLLGITNGTLYFVGYENGSTILVFGILGTVPQVQRIIEKYFTLDTMKNIYNFNGDVAQLLPPELHLKNSDNNVTAKCSIITTSSSLECTDEDGTQLEDGYSTTASVEGTSKNNPKSFHRDIAKSLEIEQQGITRSNSEVISELVIPTLGRPFQLGTLYDYRNNCLLSNVTLWRTIALKDVITKTPETVSQFDVITDLLPADALGIKGGLKLSILGGLIKEDDVSGSAKYLYNYKSSKQHAQVVIRYKYISHYQEVNHEEITNDQYCSLSEKDVGSHVVTGISYGTEAIFVIEQKVADDEKYQQISKELQEKANSFCKVLNEECDAQLPQLPVAEQCTVRYFGDSPSQEKISTFEDVAKFCKLLYATGRDSPNLVPKQVFLRSLTEVNSGMFSHLDLCVMSDDLIRQIENIIQDLHNIEIRCNSLMKTNVYQYFIGIQEQLTAFSNLVSKYQLYFVKQLAILLPKIRVGQEKEQELEKLCKMYLTSQFNCEVLSSWIIQKECEVNFIDECLVELEHVPGIKFKFPSVIDPMKTVIAFEFKAINKIDLKMSHLEMEIPWYKIENINITQKIKQFSSYAKSNADDDSITFIVTDTSKDTYVPGKGVQIVSYINGQRNDYFQPPCPPHQLISSNKQHDSIELAWSKPQCGSTSVQSYTVFYHTEHDLPEECKSQMTEGDETAVVITDLIPNTSYTFKVQANCTIGKSETCENITTKMKAPVSGDNQASAQLSTATSKKLSPGRPKAIKKAHNSIELTWKKPKPCSLSIDRYIVSCFCLDNDDNDDDDDDDDDDDEPQCQSFETKGDETTIIIPGLIENTTYQFNVKAQYKTGLSKSSKKRVIKTHPRVLVAGPPGKPSVVNRTSNSIELKWKKPQENSDNMDGYKVLYCSKDDLPDSEWKSQQTNGVVEHIMIRELVPEKMYCFKVQAMCNETAGKTSDTIDAKTKCKLLSPGKPIASKITHDSLKLYWSEPQKQNSVKIYDTVQLYRVLYKPLHDSHKSRDIWTSCLVESTQTKIYYLSPATKYIFKVQAGSSDHSFGMESEPSIFMTKQIIPGHPGKPRCVKHAENYVHLQWTKPKQNAEIVQYYVVSYCCIDDSTQEWEKYDKTTESEEIEVTGLFPLTRYCFTVQAISSIGGPSKNSDASDTIQTSIPKPGIPDQPKAVSITHNSINLKWIEPTQHPLFVKTYCVYYFSQEEKSEKKSVQFNTEEKKFEVTGLFPKTTYLFQVQAQNKAGSSEMSEVSDPICTSTPIPSQPGQPQSVNISHDTVTITWAKPQENAEYVQNYIIQCIETSGSVKTVKTESAVKEFVASGLKVNTEYTFKVKAESIDGTSEESDTSAVIRTLVPVPSKPEQLKAVSVTHNSVNLEWTKPAQYSGYVTNYQVHYFSQEEPKKITLVAVAEEKVTVSQLSPETNYVFRLQAQSETGSSDKSEISIRTLPPVPSKPGQPQPVNISHDEITITWAKPQENAEYIESYTINYTKDSETYEWTAVSTNIVKEVLVVSGLEPNTNYIFKVQAESPKGRSKNSEVSNVIKTRCPVPSQPGKPKCKTKAHDSITLIWSKPNEHYENVECYEVFYYDNKIEKTKFTDGRVEEIIINGLDPQKGYYFKVQAKSKFGDSPNSLCSDQIGTNHIRPVLKILPHCEKLQDSQTIRLLRTTKSTTKQKFAKHEYGEATHGTTNKVLMVVGATGSGKSTLINGMVNYLLGVQWDDEFRLKLIHDEVETQTKSVTKLISAYTFHKQDDFPLHYSLTIVDTPGFGDTEGIARDREITSQIQEFFSLFGEQGIDHLDGIGFVTQGGQSRLTPTQLYIFDSIFSIFGNDMKDNIYTMVTFADSANPPVIGAIKEAKIPCIGYFQFNNSALYTVNTNTFAKMFWDMGAKSFNEFFNEFETSKSVSLILTKEVLDQRKHLEAVIIGLHNQIQAGMLKINNLKREQKILQENEEIIKTNENFMYDIEEDSKLEVKLGHGRYVTNCVICKSTCHFPCTISKNEKKNGCASMKFPRNKSTTCKVCPGRCSWQYHRNDEYRIEFKRTIVKKCYEDVKKMYTDAKDGKTKVEQVIARMEKEIQVHFKTMLQNIIEAHDCIRRLDEIALKRHPLTDVGYIDLLIEAELRERKSGFKERVENYRVVREQAELIGKAKEMPQETLSIEESAKFWNKFVQVEPDISLPPVQIPSEEAKSRVLRTVDKVVNKVQNK